MALGEQIKKAMVLDLGHNPVQVDFIDAKEVDSTNQWLKRHWQECHPNHITALRVETQTAGKGSISGDEKKAWMSPKGNLFLSLFFILDRPLEQLQHLALVMAVTATDLLRTHTHLSVAIKWPNDLLISDKKLGGILLETFPVSGNTQPLFGIVLGIGINLEKTPHIPHKKYLGATSLAEHGVLQLDPQFYGVALTHSFAAKLAPFLESGYRYIESDVNRFLAYKGQEVTFEVLDNTHSWKTEKAILNAISETQIELLTTDTRRYIPKEKIRNISITSVDERSL